MARKKTKPMELPREKLLSRISHLERAVAMGDESIATHRRMLTAQSERERVLTAERDYYKQLAKEGAAHLLGLTNSMTLAGRGWLETVKRHEQHMPDSLKPRVVDWVGITLTDGPETRYRLAT